MKITITEGNKSVTIDTIELNGNKTNIAVKKSRKIYIAPDKTRANKYWTIEEKKRFLELHQMGWSDERIAQELKRKTKAIRVVREVYLKRKPEWFKKA